MACEQYDNIRYGFGTIDVLKAKRGDADVAADNGENGHTGGDGSGQSGGEEKPKNEKAEDKKSKKSKKKSKKKPTFWENFTHVMSADDRAGATSMAFSLSWFWPAPPAGRRARPGGYAAIKNVEGYITEARTVGGENIGPPPYQGLIPLSMLCEEEEQDGRGARGAERRKNGSRSGLRATGAEGKGETTENDFGLASWGEEDGELDESAAGVVEGHDGGNEGATGLRRRVRGILDSIGGAEGEDDGDGGNGDDDNESGDESE